jgi:hypothetical protein
MDLRLVINRGLTYLFASAILSVIVIFITRLILSRNRLAPEPRDALVVVIVSLLMLSLPGQRVVERLVDPYLYRRRLDYPSALREAAHRLSRLMQPAELADELHAFLSQSFLPDAFTMVVRISEGESFEIVGPSVPISEPLRDLVGTLVRHNTPSVFFVNPSAVAGQDRRVHRALREFGIELVVTLGRRAQPFGAILLGPRRSGDAYFAADLTFVESLAELASIALENSLLYRQRIQMLEYSDRLLEALDSAVLAVDVDGRITSLNSAA